MPRSAEISRSSSHPVGDRNGETETGVTIMRIDAGLDTGDMLLKRAVDIGRRKRPRS